MEEDREKPRQVKKIAEFRVNFNLKNIFLWLFIVILGISFFLSFQQGAKFLEEKPLSEVLNDIRDGKVQKVEVTGEKLTVFYKTNKAYTSHKESQESLIKILETSKIDPQSIEIQVKDSEMANAWWNFLSTVLPLVLMVAFFFFIFRQARGAQDTIFSFGQSRARLFSKDTPRVTFADVAGVDEAKQELSEVVDFLKHPGKYRSLGARTPKGVLLVGPSGTGKTLLARAVAGEAGVAFFSMAGSEFMEMLVGVGSARMRDLFQTAKKNAPCLPGKTRISLADGRELTIEEMFEKKMVGEKVISMANGGVEAAKVMAITRREFNQLCQIKTLHFEIEATPNHLFPVFEEGRIVWKRADELSQKDYLAYPQKISTQGGKFFLLDFLPPQTRIYLKGENSQRSRRLKSIKLADWQGKQDVSKIDFLALGSGGWTDSKLVKIPPYLNWDLVYLLGLLLADGNFSKTNRFNINFINTEESLHRKVKEIIKQNFGYLPRLFLGSQSKKGNLSKRKTCWVTQINNRLIRILFENLQEKLLVLPQDLIAAFISGYFDGDGYVAKKYRLPKIVLSAWDEDVNSLLRSLLHRLGVTAYKSRISPPSGNIEITGKEAIEKLREKIISFHPQKKERLAYLKLKGVKGSRLDGIPLGSFLKTVRESLSISQRGMAMGGKISDYERNLHVPSRESLRRIIYKMEEIIKKRGVKLNSKFLQLKKIVFGEINFTKVIQITFWEKPCFVYDLCLNDHHNFVANGLFVHNCIIFIDEIDAIGRTRSVGVMGAHDEREQTLNQMLVEMDGFTPNENVIVLAATNRPDILDSALLRPGRFDRRVVLDMPDIEGRKAILTIHMKGKPFASEVDWDKVARRTVGFSGADLENMLNEAAILAARLGKKSIDMEDLEEAATKVKLGPEKKRLQSDLDKKMTAYHEAGHAIVTHLLPHMDPVHRISIVSRGLALGFTLIPPAKDRYTETRSHLLEQVTSLLGGRAAEEIVFDEFTAGAASDIQKATEIARTMVVEYGMSELGPINFGPQVDISELGRVWYEPTQVSPEMAAKVDSEIKKIIDNCYKEALGILKKLQAKLDLVAGELVKKETIEGEEFEKLLGVKKLAPTLAKA